MSVDKIHDLISEINRMKHHIDEIKKLLELLPNADWFEISVKSDDQWRMFTPGPSIRLKTARRSEFVEQLQTWTKEALEKSEAEYLKLATKWAEAHAKALGEARQ